MLTQLRSLGLPVATLTAALALVALAARPAAAESMASGAAITLREHLNQTYARELLHYPFEPKSACVADSLQVAGPKGPVAAQLTDVELESPKSDRVKSAKLAILVDELKPLTSTNYTVTYGKAAAAKVASDLAVAAEKGQVTITTAGTGVRLLLGGEKPAAPVALKEAPGILIASRLGTGAWAGGSKFTGDAKLADAKVVEWSSKLTDSGPAFARVVARYVLADGGTITVGATVVAGDSAVRWEMRSSNDNPTLALEFRLPPVPGVAQFIVPKGFGQWAKGDRTVPMPAPAAANDTAPKPFNLLAPDVSLVHIFAENGWSFRLAPKDGPELRITARDPGAWVDPVAPLTYGGFKTWNLTMIEASWENWRRKRVPLFYAADGTVTMQATLAKGGRKWMVSAGEPKVGESLDKIKEMVLDWPADTKRPNPRVFVDMKEIEAGWAKAKTDPQLAKWIGGEWAGGVMRVLSKPAAERTPAETAAVVTRLREQLALLGNFDTMRSAIGTACMYDALIESPLITPQEKSLFRAQMAYLAYLMTEPQCWSMERGYHSGNPNMSCSYTLSQGVIAATLVDHPAAKAWGDYCVKWEDKWLNDEVGANGEWIPEGGHYGYVSLDPLVVFAIAAQRAGFHDFTNDPRLKKLVAFFAKTQTPRDPMRSNVRGSGGYGRGTTGDHFATFGVAARMLAKNDPALSKSIQYIWNEVGNPPFMGDSRMGGYEAYYSDTKLPAASPNWGSERFPELSVVLRNAYGTPQESFLHFLACVDSQRNLDVWTPGVGAITQWFARGVPVSICQNNDLGYACRHELLRDGVRLARNWGGPADPKIPFGYYTKTNFGSFADLPTADYTRSNFVNTKVDDRDWFPAKVAVPAFPKVTPAKEGKLDWTRQLLFLKDADAAGPAWIALRDTTVGGQPTAWQFWTLSDKLGSADQAKDAAAFLGDKPGDVPLPARELPMGNRYTALGKFEMDVEYFIASPANTPRHTLRYGGTDNSRIAEWQDLMHLQLPGDGHYFVALYPHPRKEAAPTFTTLADGTVIKAAGAFGTDLAFLSDKEATASAEGVSFKGTAGSFQQRPSWTALSLAAPGKVEWNGHALSGDLAASLNIAADKLTLTLPAENAGGVIALALPGSWKASDRPAGVKVDNEKSAYTITVPKGAVMVVFVKK
ncbi:MAG: hypothetical protein NTW19_09080 [Planctomycetota bacterium]|nr:hypothetical protein [Planctomycetota bacterium]